MLLTGNLFYICISDDCLILPDCTSICNFLLIPLNYLSLPQTPVKYKAINYPHN